MIVGVIKGFFFRFMYKNVFVKGKLLAKLGAEKYRHDGDNKKTKGFSTSTTRKQGTPSALCGLPVLETSADIHVDSSCHREITECAKSTEPPKR